MRLIAAIRARLRRLKNGEDGYTMIAAIGAVALLSVLSAAALAATQGDIHLTQRDLERKQAFAAAQAGIADFSFHLNNDNSYWAKCTKVPTPNAMNPVGVTTNRRTLSGGGEYAIESLPAAGFAKCDPENSESMIEKADGVAGTFRIRSTGFVGEEEVSLVASYKRASFLDFIYMTDYETSDPLTYGTSTEVTRANNECKKYRRQGRNDPHSAATSTSGPATKSAGPLHTNDELAICGTPKFGRGPTDTIEVSAKDPGWFDGKCEGFGTAKPEFVGPLKTTADTLEPPPTNGQLKTIAGPSYTFTCASSIVLSGTNMTVTSYNFTGTKAIPASGVVYVANGDPERLQPQRQRMVRLPIALLALQGDLLERSEVRQRLRQRQIQRQADDRRRQRHHHQRQPDPRRVGDVGPDCQQLHTCLAPIPDRDRGRDLRLGRRRRRDHEPARSTPRCWRSPTPSSSTTTTAATASAR